MEGLSTRVFALSEKNNLLSVTIEGDVIVSPFSDGERVLEIDYNTANRAVLISRVQSDPEGIVKRTISLDNYYPISLSAIDIEVIYKGQGDYDRCNEILNKNPI